MKKTPRFAEVTPKRFLNEIKPLGRPAILQGLVADWPAVAAGREGVGALAAYLDARRSHPTLTWFEAPPEAEGRIFYNDRFDGFNFARHEGSSEAFLRRLEALAGEARAPALYAGSLTMGKYFAPFRVENSLARMIPASNFLESIWVGNRTRISPHFDRPENLACCVAGERVFTLFPPEQTANLYMGPLDLTPAGQPISLVDPKAPDLDRYPRFVEALAAAEVAELSPGDVLYIPSLWWHGVDALSGFGVLVNYWWDETPSWFGAPELCLRHALLSLKSLPAAEKAKWRAIFDYLIFEVDGEALAHLDEEARGVAGVLNPQRSALLRREIINGMSPPAPDFRLADRAAASA
ncbi:cupin-like domain-containing protein [Phenylobacterium montanum]|uniref:Cupin-like domain-containing protein n=1 Tax=Phenylobacterium montanum TaxID=2823693 RepID=A0A975G3C1_9CAUL|nr:cupin-like domain-containing protein [Caulobacter sp. S6]QUD89798.1 cupin-like domain-containing protein [Caulobacter sp. S6]